MCTPEKRMPERLLLTGGPEEAAAQLIADLERRGIMERQPEKEYEQLKRENEELKFMNKILERQIGRLMSLSAELARPSVEGGLQDHARRGNTDMILEAAPP